MLPRAQELSKDEDPFFAKANHKKTTADLWRLFKKNNYNIKH